MKLVVDANILVSFFKDNPVRFIIVNSDLLDIKLFIPEYAIEELQTNKSDILKYSKLNSEKFKEVLLEMQKFFGIIPKESFKEFEAKAKQFSPHNKDAPYFALALKLGADIWSNEPRLKKQSSIKVWSTEDLRKFLEV